MTSKKLDWQNPNGMETFGLYKETIEMESCKGIELPLTSQGGKPKAKDVFCTLQSDMAIFAATDNGSRIWSNPAFKFLCLLELHLHEMAECGEWLGLKPAERWEKTKENPQICYTCQQPRFECKGRVCGS